MYGLGIGPSGGRSLFLDSSYDLSAGRAVANPPARDGGRPPERVTGGQVMFVDIGGTGISVPLETAAPPVYTATDIVNSSGVQNAPGASTSVTAAPFEFSSLPWYAWAGGALGLWWLFGGKGRR